MMKRMGGETIADEVAREKEEMAQWWRDNPKENHKLCARQLVDAETAYHSAAYRLAAANALLRNDQAANETGDPVVDRENKVFRAMAISESKSLTKIVRDLHDLRATASVNFREACISAGREDLLKVKTDDTQERCNDDVK
jgi:hypothetical protein